MTDYSKLRNRTYQEYMDVHTEANRRAWRIEQKAVNMMEAPLAPSADIGTIASNAKLGSNLISLLKDVLNNVRLRTTPNYLLLKPSTLDFSKAKEVLNDYINELKYTVMPILRNSSGNNNVLLSNTFNNLSEILRLLNMIVAEFNKIEIGADEFKGLEKYRPEKVPFSRMSDSDLERFLKENLSVEEKNAVSKFLNEKEKEAQQRIYDALVQQGKTPAEALKESQKYKLDKRTTTYKNLIEEGLNAIKEKEDILVSSKKGTTKAIYQFYQSERDNFLEYRDTIIGLVKMVSNYQSTDLPYTYGSMNINDLYERLQVYLISYLGNKESPEILRKQYPLMKDLPDFVNTLKNSMDMSQMRKIVDGYLDLIKRRQDLNSVESLTSDTLAKIYEDLKDNRDFKKYRRDLSKVVYNKYKSEPNMLADDGRDVRDESAPIDTPSSSTTGLSVEDAPIQPSLPVEPNQEEEKKSGEGRRRYKKTNNPRIVYDGDIKEDKLMKMAGNKYAIGGKQVYNPVQSLLDRFNEGERRYEEELTKDNLRFRVHKKGKK